MKPLPLILTCISLLPACTTTCILAGINSVNTFRRCANGDGFGRHGMIPLQIKQRLLSIAAIPLISIIGCSSLRPPPPIATTHLTLTYSGLSIDYFGHLGYVFLVKDSSDPRLKGSQFHIDEARLMPHDTEPNGIWMCDVPNNFLQLNPGPPDAPQLLFYASNEKNVILSPLQ
jgi:hypothetical protein